MVAGGHCIAFVEREEGLTESIAMTSLYGHAHGWCRSGVVNWGSLRLGGKFVLFSGKCSVTLWRINVWSLNVLTGLTKLNVDILEVFVLDILVAYERVHLPLKYHPLLIFIIQTISTMCGCCQLIPSTTALIASIFIVFSHRSIYL